MLLFRSEEHIDRWCEERRMARGGTLTLGQIWRLASAWYGTRMERNWKRRTPVEAEELFASLGLHGPFWRLT